MEFLKNLGNTIQEKRRIFIGAFSVFFSTVVIGTALVNPTYKTKAKLIVETSGYHIVSLCQV